MHNEELIEEGIVKSSKDGMAEIIISNSVHCEECSAKVYCKPNSGDNRTIVVHDTLGLKPGDFVLISVSGQKIFQTSFFLYGLPLIILILGLFIGFNIFNSQKELFSTLLSIVLLAVYFFLIKTLLDKFKYPFSLIKITQKTY
ncbi:MAG: SoxR reducing system RseC family protein [Ignavibacterium album]|uniref:SoxR reducing system RseC family protein n=1 Tax=Ignavibacterium album TaxID=591197 RepID=UPI0026F16224|nr:SoxR reducing system RseC family protein [Ignavibacterium album]MCX8104389.1 SoxR reducing system RseC family protein [Ignavibacterium album]